MPTQLKQGDWQSFATQTAAPELLNLGRFRSIVKTSESGFTFRLENAMQSHDEQRLRVGNSFVPVSAAFAQYIRDEASSRRVSTAAIYSEEMAALTELEKINPPVAEWLDIAKNSGAPEYMKDDPGGPCPF